VTEQIVVFWHPGCLDHDTGLGTFEAPASPLLAVLEKHPEGPDRIRNIHSMLKRGPIAPHLRWIVGREVTEEELLVFHTASYLEELRRAERDGGRRFTSTTVLQPGGLRACGIAAGTAIEATGHVLAGKASLAYALVRPPGHHAAPAQADGYCFLNNVALAAEHALHSGISRISIIDWDVHHGNGTQEGFYERADVLTVSMHMDHGAWGPSHLQSGAAAEVGRGAGCGFNVNVPLPMGTSDSGYLRAFEALIAPEVTRFRPELIIVAAGQDASQFDPNGRQLVTMRGFHALGAATRVLADKLCGGRLLLVQEGGYNVSYTAFCAHATLEGVLGLPSNLKDPLAYMPDRTPHIDAIIGEIRTARAAAIAAQGRHSA